MRSYFYKKTTTPEDDLRRKILRKLAVLRHDKSKPLQNVKAELRAKLRTLDGSTEYFRHHKGADILLGFEQTKKKRLLLYKDKMDTPDCLRQLRRKHKKMQPTVRRTSVHRHSLVYEKFGGTLAAPNRFFDFNKLIQRSKTFDAKKPQTREDYVGIELEYASRLSLDELADKIVELGLHNHVRVMRDSSITVMPPYLYQIELCIISKFSEFEATLDKLAPLLTRDNFDRNTSCGLHVHLDARDELKAMRIFNNLVQMQSLLFGLVEEHRRENRYCHPVRATELINADFTDHYAAISASSYTKHRTIEVRMHHSTLDLQRVKNWVNLLKKIGDYKGSVPLALGTFNSEFEQLQTNVNLEPQLIDFIQSHTERFYAQSAV